MEPAHYYSGVDNFLAHSSIEAYDAKCGEITFKSIRPQGRDSFSVKTETLHLDGALTVAKLANTGNKFLAALAMKVLSHSRIFRRYLHRNEQAV